MFEFIIAGFTGTYLSYIITFLLGQCFEASVSPRVTKIEKKLDNLHELQKELNKELKSSRNIQTYR